MRRSNLFQDLVALILDSLPAFQWQIIQYVIQLPAQRCLHSMRFPLLACQGDVFRLRRC